MNSQLLPVADFSLIQQRVDERVAQAANARALRGLRQNQGFFVPARMVMSNFLVRIGQHLNPINPSAATSEADERHVLIPLAR